MSDTLLLIDPQNDSCDIRNAALRVPGSRADMQRTADFIGLARDRIGDIFITLDSHPTVAIEQTPFWRRADGEPVEPFHSDYGA